MCLPYNCCINAIHNILIVQYVLQVLSIIPGVDYVFIQLAFDEHNHESRRSGILLLIIRKKILPYVLDK